MNHVPIPSLGDTASTHLDRWSDLLTGRHLVIVAIMASGILLYAMNLYFTAALMPSIVDDIGGNQYYAWVTTAFVISAIVTSLFVSRILDWKGPTLAYAAAFFLFALGAAINAASPMMELLIVGRVVQGLGGGLLAGLGYAVIRSTLPARHWARATSVVSAMWGLGTLFGPALGGIFAELGLWRWSYGGIAAISLLFGITAQRSFSGITGSEHRSPIPVASLIPLVLATVAISSSTIVPMGWPTLMAVGVGIALLCLFAVIERRAQNTILPHLTYRRGNRLKWIYITVAALSAGAMVEYFVPLLGQQLASLSPLIAGLLGAVLSLTWVVAQLFIVSVKSERAHHRAIRLGPLLLSAGLITYSLLQVAEADMTMVLIWAAALAFAGAGIGLAWSLLSVAAMSSLHDPAEGAKAAAGITITQLITYAITSALAGTLMAAGGESAVNSARYVTLGIALLTLFGIFSAGAATRK